MFALRVTLPIPSKEHEMMKPKLKVLCQSMLAIGAATALALGGPSATELGKNLKESRPPEFKIEEFFDTVSNRSATFSSDEKTMFYVSNASGIYNIWTVPVIGGSPVQLTQSQDSIVMVTHSPINGELIYMSDQGGNENFHLFRMPATGGSAVDLTPGEKVRAVFETWSHDGKSFLYSSNNRNPEIMDIYRFDIVNGKSEMFFENPGRDSLADWSNDGRYLALSRFHTVTNTDMFLYDTQTKDMKHLSEHEGEIVFEPTSFTHDGKGLYFLTDENSDFTYVKKMDIATGRSETIVESEWNVVIASVSHSGRYLFTATNEDGSILINMIDQIAGKKIKLPALPEGDLSAVRLTRQENILSFGFRGDTQPSDIYTMDMKTRKVKKLTQSLKGRLQSEYLVESTLLRYKTFDGRETPAYLYVPKGRTNEKLPAIVWVHGGPMGQSRKGYSSLQQFFVNHGYVVLEPNVRGSTGYGKNYHMMDDKDWGGGALQDVVYGKKFLQTLPFVDSQKVVILGGSYGGYMVLSALTREPDVFAAGVDICGPSNLFTLLASVPPYWKPYMEYFRREIGDVEADKNLLTERSPLFGADKIRSPLFVIQGANDPRVKQAESDQIVEAIKKNKGVVEYLVFNDEGHGLRKKENQIAAYRAVMEFLDRHVRMIDSSTVN